MAVLEMADTTKRNVRIVETFEKSIRLLKRSLAVFTLSGIGGFVPSCCDHHDVFRASAKFGECLHHLVWLYR
jgi:hypothetical protein